MAQSHGRRALRAAVPPRWLVHPLLVAAAGALAVPTAVFAWLVRPGGPIDAMRRALVETPIPWSTGPTQSTIDGMRADHFRYVTRHTNVDPGAPLLDQYASYVGAVLTGDFGLSIATKRPVADLLVAALPAVALAFGAGLVGAAVAGGALAVRDAEVGPLRARLDPDPTVTTVLGRPPALAVAGGFLAGFLAAVVVLVLIGALLGMPAVGLHLRPAIVSADHPLLAGVGVVLGWTACAGLALAEGARTAVTARYAGP